MVAFYFSLCLGGVVPRVATRWLPVALDNQAHSLLTEGKRSLGRFVRKNKDVLFRILRKGVCQLRSWVLCFSSASHGVGGAVVVAYF